MLYCIYYNKLFYFQNPTMLKHCIWNINVIKYAITIKVRSARTGFGCRAAVQIFYFHMFLMESKSPTYVFWGGYVFLTDWICPPPVYLSWLLLINGQKIKRFHSGQRSWRNTELQHQLYISVQILIWDRKCGRWKPHSIPAAASSECPALGLTLRMSEHTLTHTLSGGDTSSHRSPDPHSDRLICIVSCY